MIRKSVIRRNYFFYYMTLPENDKQVTMDNNTSQGQDTADISSRLNAFVSMLDTMTGIVPEGNTEQERHLDAMKKHMEAIKNLQDDNNEGVPDLQCVVS